MLSMQFWERYFQVYDVLNQLIPYDELLASIVAALDVRQGDTIFDAGSGTGNLALKLHQAGARVTGFDRSEVGTNIHRAKVPGEVLVGDILAPLPFPDASFDKVCSNNVLYTLPLEKQLSVVRELHRILKPGGTVVLANITEGFQPIAIYAAHLRQDHERSGFFPMLGRILQLLGPTARMFYYNWLIKREHRGAQAPLPTEAEQRQLLIDAGFRDVSMGKRVYAGHGILHRATK